MSWRVIASFADAQDSYYVYNAGDLFPRIGAIASETRLESLSTNNNAAGVPLIKMIEEPTAEVETPKPKRRKQKGSE